MEYMANEITNPPASSTVDLSGLPESVVQSIKRLVDSIRERLPAQGQTKAVPERPPLRGRFADLKLSIPQEDIDEARREAWAKFPRDLPEPGTP
jgi:hypothetical protein